MLHYLFTNDLRRDQWPEILVDSAKLIRDDAVPDQHEDKSKNNYINTQQSYLCIHKGTKANELCCKGDVNAVILNFINRFQFPNARTEASFNSAVADHMAVAPLRCAVQLLFVLGMVDAGQAYMDCPEFAKYIICNSDVATGKADLISLAQQIVSDRLSGVITPPVPESSTLSSMGIEWKHCPRQIKEVFNLLQFVPFLKLNDPRLELVMPGTIDAKMAKMFFCIVNNHELWAPPNTSNWPDIQKSYLQYMDSGVTQYMTGDGNVGSKSLPHVDLLTVALKMFAERRGTESPGGWNNYDEWTKGVRDEFSQVGESLLARPGFDYAVYLRKYSISWQVVNTKFAPHTSAEKHAVLKFLREQKESPKSVSWYIDDANRLEVGGNRVDGMSAKTLLYFMSELRPAEFAPWTEPTYEGLAFLGLHKGPAPRDLTVETYEDCKAKQHQIVARMKELAIGKATDDATDPDYRTVNEFLWWLGQNDNKDLIKEKIMAKEFKNVSKKAKTGERKLSKAVENDEMMQRLMAALRTKPFAILAGHSGTGKSQLVRRLAYMTCNDEGLLAERNDYNAPGNYCMVQVKPNWHDSTDLLGYYTEMNGGKYHTTSFVEFICKAYAYPETPFFVCLDEMNLAPVEQYFAEFLSAIESYSETTKCTDRLITEKASPEEICGETKLTESLEEVKKHGLTIPRNLFVVGTVNVDETTCQFSRKVLDRAMTILMTAVSFKSMTEPNDPSKEECLDLDGIRFFLERPTQTALVPEQMDRLDEVQKQIGDTPFAIAYRFANEYALYQAAYQILMDKGVGSDGKPDLNDAESQKTALDHVVLMKLLPRIHGEKVAVKNIFCGYDRKKEGGATEHIDGLKSKLPSNGLSVDMMDKILARPDEYLTFWP